MHRREHRTTGISVSDQEFWKIEGVEIESQHEFYERLSRLPKDQDKVLKNLIYKPSTLAWSDRVRTIKDVTFSRVSFSRTKIRGVRFYDCSFKNCLFVGTKLDLCSFQRCRFSSTNTHMISIKDTYIDPKSFTKCLDKRLHQNIGVRLYQKLLKNSRDEDQIEFQRDAQFLFSRWKRYRIKYEISSCWAKDRKWEGTKSAWVLKAVNYLLRWIWEWCLGNGVRFRYLISTAIAIVLGFWSANFWCQSAFGLALGLGADGCVKALYYTIISLTTLGYGDVYPTEALGQLVASFQSIVGFFLFAMLASMLVRRVAP